MHKLQRTTPPTCLADYRHGRNAWSDVSHEHRAQIWRHLEEMQRNRCAYCEALIENGRRHIEHFRQRDRFPQGTFHWNNLFGSCNHEKCCGKHKDQCGAYDPADLIKPDEENPERFFVFVSDGTIKVRQGLNHRDEHRARETLRIFNLDANGGRLRQMRKTAVARHLGTAQAIAELAKDCTIEELRAALQDELDAIADEPFVTAIRHALQP